MVTTNSVMRSVHCLLVHVRRVSYCFMSSTDFAISEPSSGPYRKSLMIVDENVSPLADSSLLRSCRMLHPVSKLQS